MWSFYLANALETPWYLIGYSFDCFFFCSITDRVRKGTVVSSFAQNLCHCARDHHFSEIMKSIDSIKTMSGPVYDLGQDSKHSCNEVTKTVDRIKTLAYPGDPFKQIEYEVDLICKCSVWR